MLIYDNYITLLLMLLLMYRSCVHILSAFHFLSEKIEQKKNFLMVNFLARNELLNLDTYLNDVLRAWRIMYMYTTKEKV